MTFITYEELQSKFDEVINTLSTFLNVSLTSEQLDTLKAHVAFDAMKVKLRF